MKRIAGHLFRYLWVAFAIVVIVYALMVVAAREFLPVINRYQPQINTFLSEKTGLDFQIKSLGGVWEGFSPQLALGEILISNRTHTDPALTVEQLDAEINLLKTALNLSPVWRELTAASITVKLEEDEQGRWTLGGYPLSTGAGGASLDYIYRMFYYSRLLRVDDVIVDMHFYAGSRTRLYARDLQVENDGDFHRTTGSIALSEKGKNIADFIFEGRGDPEDGDEFSGLGFIHLNRINMEGSLRTLVAGWFPDLVEQIGNVETELDLSFWFDWTDSAVRNGRGRLRASEVPLPLLPDSPALKDVNADITGWYHPGEDWGFRLQQLQGSWDNNPIEPIDFQFRQRVGRRWGELDLAINHLDLNVTTRTLLNANVLGDKGEEVLSALNPAGSLHRLNLDVNFTGADPQFRVRARLQDVALASWKGSPAARGVSGYIESGLHEGFAVIDSPAGLALHYGQAYEDFMPYGATRGKLRWQWLPGEERVRVTSNLIDVNGEEGQGKVFLHLDLPTVPGGDPQMFLMVGMQNSHTRFVDRYLPKVLNEELSRWLDRGIGDGDIPEAGFIWRGSLKKELNQGRSIQVYAKLRNGAVNYFEGWPAATDVAATLTVNNTEMDARISSGSIAGETFKNLGVNLRQRGSGPLLRVVGSINTDVRHGFDVLAESPLREPLGNLVTLDARGDAEIDLDLCIPLSADKREEEYLVDVRLRDAHLVIPGTSYNIEKIRGAINYSQSRGITSDKVSGMLWDKPVSAQIESDNGQVRLQGEGVLGETALAALLGDFDGYLQGEFPVAAELTISGGTGSRTLILSSNLEGLQIDLPEPFMKTPEQVLDSRVALEISDSRSMVRGNVSGRLAFAGEIGNGGIRRGVVNLLADSADLPRDEKLLVTGRLPAINGSEWQELFKEQSVPLNRGNGLDNIRFDLYFDDLTFSNFALDQTRLQGRLKEQEGWFLSVKSPQVAGDVVISRDTAPLQLKLEYLKLPGFQDRDAGSEIAKPEAGALEQLSPMTIPELDVSIRELFYRGDSVGQVAFKSRRLQRGILITDIEGTLRGIQIKPQPLTSEGEEIDPAQLEWTVTESGNSSFFSGKLETNDMESALAPWGVPAPFVADSSTFFVNFGWEGKPWQINTLGLDGYLGIELQDGEFFETRGSAANALLKLVGLINFDTWLRRLRFDFSDFFSEGLSFDKVEGGLLFRKGKVGFEDPVIASMPSGKIRLLGSADLIYEQLDANLVVTMPVGTNLPWVAGLLGGLPAAAGVYLTSKLFEKQVDQLSSIGYRVTGAFDDPDIEVERIFTDPTNLPSRGKKPGDK